MEKMECDDDTLVDERDVLMSDSAQDSEHNTQISPLLCCCGNQACLIEHEGIYCSIDCAHHDTYQALVHGSSTSHYRRIQKANKNLSLLSPDSTELASSEKGQVIAKTDALRDHAYMSIEEWASFVNTVVDDTTLPSDTVDAAWKKAGELAQKQRKVKTVDAQSNNDTGQPGTHMNVDEKTAGPPLSTPSTFPRRQRGRAVENVRPILNM